MIHNGSGSHITSQARIISAMEHAPLGVLIPPAVGESKTRGGGWCCVGKARFCFGGQREDKINPNRGNYYGGP